jgi:hypothetical protein
VTGRILAIAVVVLAGCAASPPPSRYAERDIRRDEILMLDGKIMDYRRELGLEPRPVRWMVQMLAGGPPVAAPERRDAAAETGGDACTEVCELTEYICRAQEDICRIAAELGKDDDWAREKCDSAKASCAEAKKRCMECRAP